MAACSEGVDIEPSLDGLGAGVEDSVEQRLFGRGGELSLKQAEKPHGSMGIGGQKRDNS